MDHKIVMIGLD